LGRRLIHLDAERYARESNLRFALVHDNEHSESIAVYRGEAEEIALPNGSHHRKPRRNPFAASPRKNAPTASQMQAMLPFKPSPL
jgi:hypothetical protein